MSARERTQRNATATGLAVVVIAALAIGVFRGAGLDPVGDALERKLFDLRFQLRGPLAPRNDITIVTIDEQAIRSIGMLAPLRAVLANALDTIAEARPRVIAIDLLLADPTAADVRLAAAFTRDAPVVLAVSSTGAPAAIGAPLAPELAVAIDNSVFSVVIDKPAGARSPAAPDLLFPVPALATAALLGHVNVVRSPDGVARQLPVALETVSGGHLPAMPVVAARLALGLSDGEVRLHPGSGLALKETWIATERNGAMTLNHWGGDATFTTVGLSDVATGNVPADTFAGRVVFIGSTAQSLGDHFVTPFSDRASGVEVLAGATANLISGDAIRRDLATAVLSVVLAVAAGALVYLAGAVAQPRIAAMGAIAVWLAAAALVQVAFEAGLLWLDATAVLAALVIGSVTITLRRHRLAESLSMRMQQESRNLSRYVAPALRDTLARSETLEFDGRAQHAAVLFVDVAGYTNAVERTDPVDVATFLGDLHRFYEETAAAHKGLVIDFQGDGALVVFGLPEPDAEDPRAALRCAEAMLAGIGAIATPLFRDGVWLRVSVHFGPVAAAVLGGRHGQITVTGDTVNVAARLQDVARSRGVQFVTTSALLVAAGVDPLDQASGYRFLERAAMRGRSTPIDVFTRPNGTRAADELRQGGEHACVKSGEE